MSGKDGGDGDKGDGSSRKPPPFVLGKEPASGSRIESDEPDSDPFLTEEQDEDEDVAGVVDKGKGKMLADEGSTESAFPEITDEERLRMQSTVAALSQAAAAQQALEDNEDVAGAVDKGKGEMLAGEGSSGGSAMRRGSLGGWIPDPAATLPNLELDETFKQNAVMSVGLRGLNSYDPAPLHPLRLGPEARPCYSCGRAERITSLFLKGSHTCLCVPCLKRLEPEPCATYCSICENELNRLMDCEVSAGRMPSFTGKEFVVPHQVVEEVGLVAPGNPATILCTWCISAYATTNLFPEMPHLCLCIACVPLVRMEPTQARCLICKNEAIARYPCFF